MRKTAYTVLLALLLLQPVALASNLILGHAIHAADGPAAVAQDAGSRLEPDEYTDHVPILIDDPADWTSQGWPGSGTAGDPYVIANLRIQYDVGVPLIAIYNQDAYFVIRDCLLIQNSTSFEAVEIENTTHARVEYTTVYSEFLGMTFTNANNTVLDHVFAENDNAFASNVVFSNSLLCEVTDCESRSLAEVALILNASNNATISSSTLYGSDGGLWSFYSNYSLCEDLVVSADNTGFDGIYSEDSINSVYTRVIVDGENAGLNGLGLHSLQIEDSTFIGGDYGLYIQLSDDVSIASSHFESSAGRGAYLYLCHDATFTGNTIADAALDGLWWQGGENSTISGNTITDVVSHGIHVQDTFNVMVSDNSMEDVSGHGVYVDNSDNVTIQDNSYIRTGDSSPERYSIYVLNSDYTTITSERIEEPYSASIVISGSHNGLIDDCWASGDPGWIGLGWFSGDNWTVQDSYVEGHGLTIRHFGSGEGLKIHRNEFLDASIQEFVELNSINDFEIINNTMTTTVANAIYLNGGARGLVEGNSITDAYRGIYSSTTNVSIVSNTVKDVEEGAITISSATNPEVIDNDCEGDESGLQLFNSANPFVTGNLMTAGDYGIYCMGVTSGTFINNNLTDSGFFFEEGQAFANYNHTLNNNYVNGKPFYYAINTDSLSLDGTVYGEIMLVNCSDVDITGGSFISSSSAVRLHQCREIDITGLTVVDQIQAIQIDTAENVSISNTQIDGMNRGTGIVGNNILRLALDNVTLSAVFSDGISLEDASNVNVTNCGFYDIGGVAVDVYTGDGLKVTDIDVFNASTGLRIGDVINIIFNDNHVKWCDYGVYGEDASDNAEALRNDIHDNDWGIYLDDCYSWLISNNTIRWNEIGIEYYENYAPGLVYYNIIAVNTINNAVDNVANFWDDGVSRGNWWDDYTPPGVYTISGVGGSIDRYPMNYNVSIPIINEPQDISYAEFSTGNEITWLPFDDNLADWEVEIDGILWDSGVWNFVDITVNVDGLDYGPHDVVVTVWDIYDNYVSDSVVVTVFDDTVPTISSPKDMIIFFGVIGNEILWQVADQNPATYELYRDDVLQSTGSWSSGTISAILDGLATGTYLFELVIFDVDGHSVSDLVQVTVIRDDTPPTVSAPDDFNFTEGTIGNAIIWVASDEYPSHYLVEITEVNTTDYVSGAWGGGSFLTNIDGLVAGEYTFTVTVYDTSGNMASANVTVTVIPVGGYPPAPPPDYILLILALGVGGVVAVVILYFYFNKRRSTE